MDIKVSCQLRTRVLGVGYAACLKNTAFSEGFDDYSTARARVAGGQPVATVITAAEVGQGILGVVRQITVSELGIGDVEVEQADTVFGPAGTTAASRQTYVTGGAVRAACLSVRDEILALARKTLVREHAHAIAVGSLAVRDGMIIDGSGRGAATVADVIGTTVIDKTAEFHHRPAYPLDPVNGQRDSAVQFGFAAHGAVVDVDLELGLVTVVELATAQDVERAINPVAIAGQLHGGTAQGLGLTLMEEIKLDSGHVLNPSFATYLIPTMRDVPPIRTDIVEMADPHAPLGVGDLPAHSSTAAIVAAIRAATGRWLNRAPVSPEDITPCA